MTAVAQKEVTTRQVSAVHFGFYSDEEVRKLSVKRIVQPLLFDGFNNPMPGGLYDPDLGPLDRNSRCGKCTLGSNDCPGHFGHIDLPVPVFNPLIFQMCQRFLKLECQSCFHLKISREEARTYELKLALLSSGRLSDALALHVSTSPSAKELQEVLDSINKPGLEGPRIDLTSTQSGGRLTSLVQDAINDTVAEIMQKVNLPKCKTCGAFNPQINKKGKMKLFKMWRSAKAIIKNNQMGRKIPTLMEMPKDFNQEVIEEFSPTHDNKDKKSKGRKGDNKEAKEDKKIKVSQDSDSDNGNDTHNHLNGHHTHNTNDNDSSDDDMDENDANDDPNSDGEGEGGAGGGITRYDPKEQGNKKGGKKKRGTMTHEEEEAIYAENAEAREQAFGGMDVDKTEKETLGITAEIRREMEPKYMPPFQAQALLAKLWHREWRLLALLLGPGRNLWGQDEADPAAAAGTPDRRRRPPAPSRAVSRGVSFAWEKGQLVVRYSPEYESVAKEGYRMFFLQVLAVPPNKFRPPSIMGEQTFEHPQNQAYQRILNSILDIHSAQEMVATTAQLANVVDPEKVRDMERNRFLNLVANLQDAVAALMDTKMAQNATDKQQGIRQGLEKKEGLFRKNMMGKRVNFAARSVISPDPFIGTGEIGIPPYFAMRLCFPERVTPYNVDKLREAVVRGPYQLDGAVAVEDGRGRLVNLKLQDEKKREGIAKALLAATEGGERAVSLGGVGGTRALGQGGAPQASKGTFVGSNKIVYRHLRDGDLMLTNRQPTLHKPGLMAHRARVLKGEKTIRMHYANCATFNADFDGDEINLHLPQDHFGRAEGYHIVHADHQFIVPTDGKPIRGLIQDHVVSGVLLTKRDTWLTREEYTQLCYLACSSWRSRHSASEGPESIEFELPAVMWPKQLWSGKQVVSTVVNYYTSGRPPLTFSSGSKVPAEYWGGKASGEAEVIFHKGYMVSGCIDKNQFGKFGLVHAIQEMYGGATAGHLLSAFSRLFTAYLQSHGFTCGFDDLLLNETVEEKRKVILSRAEAIALRASAEFVGLTIPEQWTHEPHKHTKELREMHAKVNALLSERYRATRSTGAAHDMKGSGVMHPLSSEVVKACIPAGQIKPFPTNCLSLMTVSGAKGSLVNFSQISCLLGQQELEGRRVPRMASGATLPCFAPYDGGARSCGFVGDRFLSGLRPQEYYFHCMAGREGLIDTTVKTSRSGYLQRCMIKNLETLRVHYDFTVRDNADGSIVQFFYGDDGLDVTQISYMSQLGFLAQNVPQFSRALDAKAAERAGRAAGLGDMERDVADKLANRTKLLSKLDKAVKEGDKDAQRKYKAKLAAELPVMAEFPPSVLAATSEAFGDKLLTYLTANPDGVLKPTQTDKGSKKHKKDKGGESDRHSKGLVDPEQFATLMRLKYMRSLAAPGEAVGVLAAQSIGEPSTQMTLNTFHMAGRGEANVTLGIPRLREILMTAATKIKTPVMTLPLRQGLTVTDANVLAGRMRRLRLAECLSGISLVEYPVFSDGGGIGDYNRVYMIKLKFFSPAQFPPEAQLKFSELAEVFQRDFMPALKAAVDKEVKAKGGRAKSALIGRVDLKDIRGDEEVEAVAGGVGNTADEDGDGEAGGSTRGRFKRARQSEAPDDVINPDLPSDEDEGDALEREDDAQEGKNRFRGLEEEAYAAPDDEDQEADKEVRKQGLKRGLISDDESSDDDQDDNTLPGPKNNDNTAGNNNNDRDAEDKEGSPDGAKLPSKGAKPKSAKKTKASETAEPASNDPDRVFVDYKSHVCSMALHLPLQAPKLLMLEVVERVAASVMVRVTKGIDKVYVLPGDRGDGPKVQTDGVNFESVWAHDDIIDVNGITTNDIAAVLRTYGVEAARATILREAKSVFGAYGIGVDPRHLGLIADFMTHQGGYRACNRIGIESNVSPFLKMSFETATHFLTKATMSSAADDLRTPSARLCVGRVVELGTGVMDIVHRFEDEKGTQHRPAALKMEA